MTRLVGFWLTLLIFLSGPVLEGKVRFGHAALAAEKLTSGWLSPKQYVSEIKGELYDAVKATLRNVEQGQHGVIDKRVGNQLIQKANELEKQEVLPEIVEQLRTEGQRLINKGGSISHKN